MTEHFPTMCEELDLILSTSLRKNKENEGILPIYNYKKNFKKHLGELNVAADDQPENTGH